MYTRIVVPLDGSEIAETAIVEAEYMATLTNAPIHLVRVVDFSSRDITSAYGMIADVSSMSVMLADETEAASHYLGFVAKRIADQGFTVSHEVQRGTVAGQLIAATRSGDVMVMASHGRSGVARWFLGSVAEEVVRRSSVPVLLVKAATKVEVEVRRVSSRDQIAATR